MCAASGVGQRTAELLAEPRSASDGKEEARTAVLDESKLDVRPVECQYSASHRNGKHHGLSRSLSPC
jgi:hypothetical protein